MDELEAINVMLSNIGQSEVNSLTSGHPDVANARKTLDRARKRIQRPGWWFNREYELTITPEPVTGKLRVADLTEVEVRDYEIVQRGDYLYNRVTQSYVFTEAITLVTAIRYLDWDLLPDTAKDAALFRAAAEFVRDELEDPNKEAALREDESTAMVALKEEDLNVQKYNVFNKRHVANARLGVRPYSSRTRRFGAPDR